MSSTLELMEGLTEAGDRLNGGSAQWDLQRSHDGWEVVVFTKPIEHLAVQMRGGDRPFGVIRSSHFSEAETALEVALVMCTRVVRDRGL